MTAHSCQRDTEDNNMFIGEKAEINAVTHSRTIFLKSGHLLNRSVKEFKRTIRYLLMLLPLLMAPWVEMMKTVM